ncbi:MAG: hypothetical protein JF586_13670, partial [Burkholderiales bacterium]|nr:hypothetical protein [Burkholderiales bacterium]
VVGHVHGPNNWSMSLRLGVTVNLVDTGSGHALLAFQSDERRGEMLGEHEVLEGEVRVPPPELERLLAAVRARGYWQGDSQQAYGVTDISFPILGPQGDAMAVLTCPSRLPRPPAFLRIGWRAPPGRRTACCGRPARNPARRRDFLLTRCGRRAPCRADSRRNSGQRANRCRVFKLRGIWA